MLAMSLALFLVGCAVAFFLGCRKIGFFGFCTSLVLFWLAGSGVLPKLLLSGLEVNPRLEHIRWQKSNVILTLGGGISDWGKNGEPSTAYLAYARIFEAARLYQDCQKTGNVCRILLTGGCPQGYQKSEAELMAQDLKGIGIPEKDLILEKNSRNTYESSRLTIPLVASHKPDLLVLVTSGFHLYRSLLLFQYSMLPFLAAPADQLGVGIKLLPSSFNLLATDIALHEYAGVLQYRLFSALGLNPSEHVHGFLGRLRQLF